MDLSVLQFFDGRENALPIYEALEEKIAEVCPDVNKKVQKTQITFSGTRVFACVSFLRVKRKADLPDPYLVLTLGLPYPLASDRAAAKTEPYPGRWTNHVVIGSAGEVDGELISWLREAVSFSESKQKRRKIT